ncbi:uncharacterized protein LOC113515594 [Galleria mellonella]|uniref:Uncharacterized protein LOC113515594 n=1 Tax=Galleria mellonella TaxID=7137 RepID=A0ABM3MCS8_GALME|nr:uncharacterized protein LOC113515594 [Galleria mellonella]
MRASIIFLLLAMAATSLANPAVSAENQSMARMQIQTNFLGNTKILVEQLITNLQNSAKDAIDAVKKFREGMFDQLKELQEKVTANIQKLKDRVTQAIQSVSDKFSNSSSAVKACVNSHKGETETLYNETLKSTMTCANARIKEIGDQLDKLNFIATNASEFAHVAMERMRECMNQNQDSPNILSTGACLGKVALKTELKGGIFLAQNTLTISRINLALATLPAALEVCAGTQLVETGLATTKVIMDIGSCSASSVFNTFVDSSP